MTDVSSKALIGQVVKTGSKGFLQEVDFSKIKILAEEILEQETS